MKLIRQLTGLSPKNTTTKRIAVNNDAYVLT